ncbi:hypothetical protein chiPu_0021789, partial [Chiloscyllium punctatum]|nr:hypothetical protein [Chiloscyllium punctatum]
MSSGGSEACAHVRVIDPAPPSTTHNTHVTWSSTAPSTRVTWVLLPVVNRITCTSNSQPVCASRLTQTTCPSKAISHPDHVLGPGSNNPPRSRVSPPLAPAADTTLSFNQRRTRDHVPFLRAPPTPLSPGQRENYRPHPLPATKKRRDMDHVAPPSLGRPINPASGPGHV